MSTPHEYLRHTLATIAYRASKAVRGAPADFAAFRATGGSRSPAEILAHMGDLMDWGLTMSRGQAVWNDSRPLAWDDEVERFFSSVTSWDEFLATGAPLATPWEKVFQGSLADALTHVGQIAMLRRVAGAPIRGESYNLAPIRIGQTALEQPPATAGSEFD